MRAHRGNQVIRDFGYLLALVVGIVMIFVDTVLAVLARSEAALIWMGGILVIAGVLGERIRSFRISSSGVEGTLSSAAATDAILAAAAKKKATTKPEHEPFAIGAPDLLGAQGTGRPQILGSYWSAPVVAKATLAAGSNSGPELTRRLIDLLEEVDKPGAFRAGPSEDPPAPTSGP